MKSSHKQSLKNATQFFKKNTRESSCDTIEEKAVYKNLAPCDNADVNKTYDEAITFALNDDEIRNIALTGIYGSGKSSILNTFKKKHPELKIWDISLATFKKIGTNCNKQDDINDENNDNYCNEDSKLIEFSILQQIYCISKHYIKHDSKLNPKNSRINWSFVLITSSIVLLVISIAVLKLIFHPSLFLIKDASTLFIRMCSQNHNICFWISLLLFVASSSILTYMIIEAVSSLKIKGLHFKWAEMEMKNSPSPLNKYVPEILYILKKNKPDIITIQDLDRFDSVEIFTKFREINTLVNNSLNISCKKRKLKRPIKFIYAVKDDMFNESFEDENNPNNGGRTKFFDFIIPVIPIINSSNSENILNKLLNDNQEEKNQVYNLDFIEYISYYINDMRLLYNIVNENNVYNKVLDGNLNKDKLLAMIIYKNLYPKEFSNLNQNRGVVYQIINGKNLLAEIIVQKYKNAITTLATKGENIAKRIDNITNEFRNKYTEVIKKKWQSVNQITIDNKRYDIEYLNNTQIFDSFIHSNSVTITHLIGGGIYNSVSTSFSAIDKIVNPKSSYSIALKELTEKENEASTENLLQIKVQKNKIDNIGTLSLAELSDEIDISKINKEVNEKKYHLLKYLICKGFINEDYFEYISYFYPGAMSIDEHDFILSVKNKDGSNNINKNLQHLKSIVDKIAGNEFGRLEALNICLINYLLGHYCEEYNISDNKIGTAIHSICVAFNTDNSITKEFYKTYMSIGRYKEDFIKSLLSNCMEYIKYIIKTFSGKELENYLTYSFNLLDDINVQIQAKSMATIREFIQDKQDILKFSAKIIDEQFEFIVYNTQPKIKKLDNPDNNNKIFEYIYENNYYSINYDNLLLILSNKCGVSKNDFDTRNYTTITESKLNKLKEYVNSNISEYVNNIMLKIDTNKNESETSIKEICTNEHIVFEDKKNVLKQWSDKFNNTPEIKEQKVLNTLFELNKITPTWDNVCMGYFSLGNTLTPGLIVYLNNNDVSNQLSTTKIIDSIYEDAKVKQDLSEAIVASPDINIDSYKLLLNSLGQYTSLELSSIDDERIRLLIEQNKLPLTYRIYQTIREISSKLSIGLLANNITTFISEIDQYQLKGNDIDEFISQFNEGTHIISEETIVYNTLLVQVNECGIRCSHESIMQIILKSDKEYQKLELLNREIEGADSEYISDLLNSMPAPYPNLAQCGKNPKLDNSQINIALIQKLKNKDYISSYKVEGNKIIVHTHKASNNTQN